MDSGTLNGSLMGTLKSAAANGIWTVNDLLTQNNVSNQLIYVHALFHPLESDIEQVILSLSVNKNSSREERD